MKGYVHKWNSKVMGYSNDVNTFIDYPVRWMGRGHRKYFHTPAEAMLIGYSIDGVPGAIGGLNHIYLDNITDKDTKNAIEYMALMKPPDTKWPTITNEDIQKMKNQQQATKHNNQPLYQLKKINNTLFGLDVKTLSKNEAVNGLALIGIGLIMLTALVVFD